MIDFSFWIFTFSMSKRTLMNYYSSSSGGSSGSTPVAAPHTNESTIQPKKPREEFSHSNLIADPGQRKLCFLRTNN
jgi:hypothetical protein